MDEYYSSDWQIIEGEAPILLVAAHNYPHRREDLVKPRDVGTGDLVKYLCEKTGAWGIFTTSIQKDPNWYADSPFRKAVKDIIRTHGIKVVIDVHGRRENYPHLLEYLPNMLFKEKWPLREGVVKNLVKGGQFTLPKDLELEGIPCTAVEIRKDGRMYSDDTKGSHVIVKEKLTDLIRAWIRTLCEPGVGIGPTT